MVYSRFSRSILAALYLWSGLAFADGTLFLAFSPDPSRATPATSPEGCIQEGGTQARGMLSQEIPAGPCRSALFSVYTEQIPGQLGGYDADVSSFSGQIDTPFPAFYRGRLRLYFDDGGLCGDGTPCDPSLNIRINDLNTVRLTPSLESGTGEAQDFDFEVSVPGILLPGVIRIDLLRSNGGNVANLNDTHPGRLLFGGGKYADAGIYFEFDEPNSRSLGENQGSGLLVGALPTTLLLPLLALALRRRQRTYG